MTETLKQLKARALTWPEPYRTRARQLMRDAAFDLMQWPRHMQQICDDLRQSLQATEDAMLRAMDLNERRPHAHNGTSNQNV